MEERLEVRIHIHLHNCIKVIDKVPGMIAGTRWTGKHVSVTSWEPLTVETASVMLLNGWDWPLANFKF